MDTMSLDRFFGGESCRGGGGSYTVTPAIVARRRILATPLGGGGGGGGVTSPAFAKACSLTIRMVMKKHPHHKPPKVNDTGVNVLNDPPHLIYPPVIWT